MAGVQVQEFKVLGLKMWQQVLLCLVAGIAVGFYIQGNVVLAEKLKILGTLFIDLIKMVVVPLIFLALVSGITSMGGADNFKRVGLKGVVAYLATALFAVVIGLVFATIFHPGLGLGHVDITQFGGTGPGAPELPVMSVESFLLNLISTNIFESFAKANLLQVIVFAVIFAMTINTMGAKAARTRELMHDLAHVVFKMIEYIVRLAPLAVFGYMAWMVGTQGIGVIKMLATLVGAVIAACIVQYVIYCLLILVFAHLNPLTFCRKLVTTQIMAFSTSSSKATLTTAMREVETKLGVSEQISQFMLPLGAAINMSGTAIYLGICALFFAQFFGVEMHPVDYAMLLLTCTLGSIGAAGIPSGSIIFMSMVLHSVGLPIEGIGLLLGVDRILDMVRTTLNITGDCAITLIIDATEKTLNRKVYNS